LEEEALEEVEERIVKEVSIAWGNVNALQKKGSSAESVGEV
jgi:hypothetical protein